MKRRVRLSKVVVGITLGLRLILGSSQAFGQGGTWTTKAPIPTARGAASGAVINGLMYVIGGNAQINALLGTSEAYDPSTDTWTTKAPMPTPRGGFVTEVINGILYAVGGDLCCGNFTNVNEAYDPNTNTWSTKAPMPTARIEMAGGVINGVLYVVGGGVPGCSCTLSTLEAYDPVGNTWTTKAPMPTDRGEAGAAVINNILYVVSGSKFPVGVVSTLEAYDPAANTWTTKASIPTPRAAMEVGVIDGRMYVVGGTADGSTPLSVVEVYDPAADTWTTAASMPTPRFFPAGGVINGILYASTGATATGVTPANEAFTPDNTPTGTGVPVLLNGGATVPGGVSLTFSSVTTGGNTTLTTTGTGQPPPSGFKLGAPPTYYNLSTTAVFSGAVTICINYSGISFGNTSALKLFHQEGGPWIDVTTSLDTTNNIICGSVTSLSPFAIVEAAYVAQVQPPINPDGSSVFKASRGVVPVKFTLTLGGASTCALPPATISVFRVSGSTLTTINESTYLLPSDTGSNFRIDTTNCQYVYNVGTSSLGTGTYQVNISIGGSVVGSGIFGLQ